ncbi:hypothetical protein Z051_08180 [Rhodococcus rhodochrous KG-21]|uniref:Acyl-protein synthetase LuxE domain-containing protein n=1 Tax=Rhodococcus rhodochrous KG-21 TaxID=1441923 RepID=A0A0M8PI06_RHORH|nr:hypothetical protein Z051_08180 [Rhodococcus rhodochrous KG-21]
MAEPDSAFDRPAASLVELQVAAANELFQERRTQIPLLEKRASEAGIDELSSLEQLVPLLFSHTAYKSYPQSFVDRGRWDKMLQWLSTLSTSDLTNVDVTGVTNVDEWLERLWDAGHAVIATSGTSGKCSFLTHTMGDRERKTRHFNTSGWPFTKADGDHVYFWLGPSSGRTSAVEAFLAHAENWGRPGEIYALSDEPMLISEISEAAAFRTRMANGTATPDEIAQMESRGAERTKCVQEDLAKFTEKIVQYRDQPIVVNGLWGQHMMILERAHELGIRDGDFHPDTVIGTGGGVKGVALPPDYKEQVARFWGDVVRLASYGMTELAQPLPRCNGGRYHVAPGLVVLPLDEGGERLLGPSDAVDGLVDARFGFLDLAIEGRWGGIITGDKVTVDYSDSCPCGRAGITILDNITRFAQTGQNDHIGCAGTIDAYIRGAVGA